MKTKIFLVLPLFIVAAAIYCFIDRKRKPRDRIEASGTIEAAEVDVRTQEGGIIKRLAVSEGAIVKAGDLVCALDRGKLEAKRAQAGAKIREARARLALLKAGPREEEIERAKHAFLLAQDQLEEADREYRRVKKLHAEKISSQELLDRARTAVDVSRDALEMRRREYELVKLGSREEEIDMAQAALEAARASENYLKLRLADTETRSPTTGTITKKYVEQGELINAGALIATIVNLERVWLKVYIQEGGLGNIAIGKEARIRVDSHPKKTFTGRISYIASEAEFTPKNVQTKEDRVKLLFEVRIDLPNPKGIFKPGMPADAEIPISPVKMSEIDHARRSARRDLWMTAWSATRGVLRPAAGSSARIARKSRRSR
jgi:HlyD family secretion protein